MPIFESISLLLWDDILPERYNINFKIGLCKTSCHCLDAIYYVQGQRMFLKVQANVECWSSKFMLIPRFLLQNVLHLSNDEIRWVFFSFLSSLLEVRMIQTNQAWMSYGRTAKRTFWFLVAPFCDAVPAEEHATGTSRPMHLSEKKRENLKVIPAEHMTTLCGCRVLAIT